MSFRAGVHRDAGMVPLSLQVTAKGENKTTQLAALRQVSSCFQRSHPRAKRKPDPRIKALQPGSSPLGCGKIYDSHLTCMEKPCIMIDKELLLFQYYILVKLINICYTHKEKRQWQKLEL